MKTTIAIFVIVSLSLGCGTSPKPQTLNKQTEPKKFKLRVFFQQPAESINPTGDPEKDCFQWSQTAITYAAQTEQGHTSYADCNYDGSWDLMSAHGEFRSIFAIDTKEDLETKVKNKLRITTHTFAGFIDSGDDLIRGFWNNTDHICVPNPINSQFKVCGDDSYVLRGSKAARPYDQQYRLFVETYKLQMEAESPPRR